MNKENVLAVSLCLKFKRQFRRWGAWIDAFYRVYRERGMRRYKYWCCHHRPSVPKSEVTTTDEFLCTELTIYLKNLCGRHIWRISEVTIFDESWITLFEETLRSSYPKRLCSWGQRSPISINLFKVRIHHHWRIFEVAKSKEFVRSFGSLPTITEESLRSAFIIF